MVEVTRVFIHSYDSSVVQKAVDVLKERFKVVKVYESRVVPNYVFLELEPADPKEVSSALEDCGVEDFKVVSVKA